jgi:hypothetical protein
MNNILKIASFAAVAAILAAPVAKAEHGTVSAVGSGKFCYHFVLHSSVTDTDIKYGVDYTHLVTLQDLAAVTGWIANISKAEGGGAISLNPGGVLSNCENGDTIGAFNINKPSLE